MDASVIESVGTGSSFRIIPLPCPSSIVALVGLDKFTKKVSSASLSASPLTFTVTDLEVSPGSKVKVPEAAV